MNVRELYEKLNALYPTSLSCEWDNDGLMLCPDGEREVKKVLCCLDVDAEAIRSALLFGADVILSHHPMIFHPLKALDASDPTAAKALLLIRRGISVLSFHTRFDCGENGVNDTLASFFDYEEKHAWTLEGLPMGRILRLKSEMKGEELAALVKERLGCPSLRCVNPEKRVRSLALVGGAGGEFYGEAIKAGADAFLTGEAKHHEAIDALERGLCLIAAGHDYTERPAVRTLCRTVEDLSPGVEARCCDRISVLTL